jgi:hypothetical protein
MPNLNLRSRESSRSATVTEQKVASPNSLAPEYYQDHDIATTPKASTFNQSPNSGSRSPRRTRKYSGEESEGRSRKNIPDGNDVKLKKILTDVPSRNYKMTVEGREGAKSSRDSAAIEGDDEGYDDLLSAYESEGNSNLSVLH